MERPIVLLVHGMGTFSPGDVTKEFSKGVDEAAQYLGLDNFHIANEVDIREYNYSQKLDKIRKDAANYQGNISQYLDFLSAGTLGKITAKLSGLESKFSGNEFLYTHWLDVAYYGLTYHNEEIRLEWAEELSKLIKECHTKDRKLHVVGHSLGTAVVHDALAKLYDLNVGLGDPRHLSAASERFESLWLIANVSRLLFILTRFTDPTTSIVHDSNPEMAGCANYFYNVGNKFDPFLFVKHYDREIEHGRHITFEEIRELKNSDPKVNPHDLTEYLACPLVTKYFLFRTLGKTFDQVTTDNALTAYKATTIQGQLKQTYENIITFRDELGDIHSDKLDTVVKAFDAVEKAIKELGKLA